MPVGGLESKADGGKAAGVEHVLCPVKNEKDLKKIRKRINLEDDKFKITMISSIYEALNKFLLLPQFNCRTIFKKI